MEMSCIFTKALPLEKEHKEIYDILGIPHEVMKPKKIWSGEKGSDGKIEINPLKINNIFKKCGS